MPKENIVRTKAYALALLVIRICRYLQRESREYVLSKQLLRSGTSIGANIEEAQKARSKKEFAAKCAIALKEAYESRYWISLIRESGICCSEEMMQLTRAVEEITRILAAIVKTSNGK